MPITAERMLDLIEIASQAVDRTEIARQKIDYIGRDIKYIKQRLSRLEINDERIDDLIISITTLAKEAETECSLPVTLVRNLGFEKARFEINLSKNKNAKERMRILRDGTRTKDFTPRGKKDQTQTTERMMSILAGREDKEYFKQKGQENHPELGDCDGEPCRKCQEKRRKTETETLCSHTFGDQQCGVEKDKYQNQNHCDKSFAMCRDIFHNTERFGGFPSQAVDVFTDDGVTYSPAKDENDEWKPRDKEEKQ
jgi:hypothetical protein